MARRAHWFLVLAIAVVASTPAAIAEDADIDAERKLILVLSGGGARGTAHVGVLEALEEMRIAPDLIIGTSMGSIVGGLYAAGWSPAEMRELLAGLEWNDLFSDSVPRSQRSFRRKQDDRPALIKARVHFTDWKPRMPASLLGGQQLELFMDALQAESARAENFDDLNIPFRAVAADLDTGEAVVIADSDLSTAMRASMSIPGAFTPVELDGRRLVDGGTVANLPIGIARDLGATSVIAVDIATPIHSGAEGAVDFLSILNQSSSLMGLASRDANLRLLTNNDVLIKPDLGDISFVDFDRSLEAAELGAAATRAMASKLARFRMGEEAWRNWLERQRRRPRGAITVDTVRLVNTSAIDDHVVRRQLSLDPPAVYDAATLLEELMRLHSLRLFGVVDFDLHAVGEQRELVISTPPDPDGHASVQFGLGFSDDFNGNIGYTVTARHQLLAVNRRGGEWQNVLQLGTRGMAESSFYQPLDAAMRWFVEPSVGFRRDLIDLWEGGQPFVEYEVERLGAELAAGRTLGRWGELRASAFTADYRATPRVGSPGFPADKERQGGLGLDLRIDTVDNVVFPRRGAEGHVSYARSSSALGAEQDFERAAARLAWSFSSGRNTFTPYLEYGENSEPTLNYLDLFKLGGLGRLSGLGNDELLGEKLALARLLTYRRLTGFAAAGVRVQVYAGLSVEAGNVYQLDEEITTSSLLTSWSLFVGADTPLGPFFLGYGRTEGRGRYYLSIGDRF